MNWLLKTIKMACHTLILLQNMALLETTVRDTWRKRHWKDALKEHTNLRDKIRDDLLGQMRSNGVIHGHFLDLVEDYMAMWDIKKQFDC